ncbi:MAG: hypothetical protein M1829_006694 [Trizodia sp. TS-e1964]|nr:MAG: hypothetical protein M1829_006694 [Trizodia sp. TS-e1964]
MYNPYQQAPPYGRPQLPPGYPGFPGAQGVPMGMPGPPGMGAPPGMSAPGVAPPPGMLPLGQQQLSRPGNLPPSFQAPPNMPNINFSAPVIRLGTSGPSKSNNLGPGGGRKDHESGTMGSSRPGLGAGSNMDQQRQALKDSMMALVPPTNDEVRRTIFIGAITEGCGGDEGVERILRSAGHLRKWCRALDADNKDCNFGFAEYDDPESLSNAVEILRDVQVPVKRPTAGKSKADMNVDQELSKLLVVVDDETLKFIEHYFSHREPQEPSLMQSRLDMCRKTLSNVLLELQNPQASLSNGDQRISEEKAAKIETKEDEKDLAQTEIVTIPLTIDDELSEIPVEMRETVAREIAAFRDRSNRRDKERLAREEEMESMERHRNSGASKPNRLATTATSAPVGPAGGPNGIPLGPRDRGIQGAPVGPKSLQGQQIPRDYHKGVSFVNGSGVNGAAAAGWINRDDEDSDASDEELERRRIEKKAAEQEKLYLDQERRWLNRERARTAAVEREKARDAEDVVKEREEKEAMAKRLGEWNDDLESSRKVEEYYVDRSLWIRNRAAFRAREIENDERDRAAEEREKARHFEREEQARGMADQFLARQAEEIELNSQKAREPQRFKLSLGAAAQKAQAAAPRRTVAEVEGLLEDEEEEETTTKRTLVPIKFDSAAEAQGLSEEERDQAVRQLAAEIPSDKEGLWKWPVKWEFVDAAVVKEKLKPFVERKIMEYLGVQEQMLVEVVEDHVRKRGGPQDLVEQLEGALDDEAAMLVKKLWRMLIFFSESEKRGLSA